MGNQETSQNKKQVYVTKIRKFEWNAAQKDQLMIITSVIATDVEKQSKKSSNEYFKQQDPTQSYKRDFQTMHKWAKMNKVDVTDQIQLNCFKGKMATKIKVMQRIKLFFDRSKIYKCSYLYFSGYAEYKNGSWLLPSLQGVFQITFNEIMAIWRQNRFNDEYSRLFLCIDANYSGKWVSKMNSKQQPQDQTLLIRSSCKQDQFSYDQGPDFGSTFTFCFFGKPLTTTKLFQNSIACWGDNFYSTNKSDPYFSII